MVILKESPLTKMEKMMIPQNFLESFKALSAEMPIAYIPKAGVLVGNYCKAAAATMRIILLLGYCFCVKRQVPPRQSGSQ